MNLKAPCIPNEKQTRRSVVGKIFKVAAQSSEPRKYHSVGPDPPVMNVANTKLCLTQVV
jgi:hypothetical protein